MNYPYRVRIAFTDGSFIKVNKVVNAFGYPNTILFEDETGTEVEVFKRNITYITKTPYSAIEEEKDILTSLYRKLNSDDGK